MATRAEAEALVVEIDKAWTGLGQAEVGDAFTELAVRIRFQNLPSHLCLPGTSGAPRTAESGVKTSGDAGWGIQAAAGDGWDEPETAPVAAPSPSRYCSAAAVLHCIFCCSSTARSAAKVPQVPQTRLLWLHS